MNRPSPNVLEPLTYWLRLEDLLADTAINDRLIDQARRGLQMLQAGADLANWARESESLLREGDDRLREVGVGGPELVSIGHSAPSVESLRSVLEAITEVRPTIAAPVEVTPVFAS